jgi:DNA-binding YbaB/EbfC family protein
MLPPYFSILYAMAFDMMGMMGKVKELQDKMQVAQSQLEHLTATGEAGGGLVKATANGQRHLLKLDIDPSLLTPEDREMLPDLVIAAVNKALDAAAELARQEMQRQTSGLLPNMPGLDLSNFGG